MRTLSTICPLPGASVPELCELMERKLGRRPRELVKVSPMPELMSGTGGIFPRPWFSRLPGRLRLCFPRFVSFFSLAEDATESIV